MLPPVFLYHQLFTTPPVPDRRLDGQTIIITGGNRGLGFEVATYVVKLGVTRLILAVRSTSAGEEARTKLLELRPSQSIEIEVWPLDMNNHASIKKFANRVSTDLPRLDVLLNNAGILTQKYSHGEQEELTLAVNVINAFMLSLLLLPKLHDSAAKFGTTPRISIVGSEGMNWVQFKERKAEDGQILTTLSNEAKANMGERYFLTKLLVMLCVRELASQMNTSDAVRKVILNCPAPGFVATDLSHEAKGSQAFRIFEKILARDVDAGSRCIVDGISQSVDSHGKYLSECKIKPGGSFFESSEGRKVGKRVWDEVLQRLEKISPGISANIL